MNLRDMHYILAVAKTGSFVLAAEQCHVSQPTLSMQIRKLEDFLGVMLFERTSKNILLTEAGSRILAQAQKILDAEKDIIDIARAMRDPRAGEFRLGAFPTLAGYVFPSFMPVLAGNFPDLHLLLVEEKTEGLVEQIKAGKMDAALLALPVGDGALIERPLFDDPFLLAINSYHPLAERKSVRIEELKEYVLLMLEEGHCLHDQIITLCHFPNINKSFRATNLETLRLMLREYNDLMTLIPSVAAIPSPNLCYIPFEDTPPPSRRIGLVSRKTSVRDGLIQEIADILKTALPCPSSPEEVPSV